MPESHSQPVAELGGTRAHTKSLGTPLLTLLTTLLLLFSSASARPYGISGPHSRFLGNAQHWHPDHYEIQE